MDVLNTAKWNVPSIFKIIFIGIHDDRGGEEGKELICG
jgi:hypothetical protein